MITSIACAPTELSESKRTLGLHQRWDSIQITINVYGTRSKVLINPQSLGIRHGYLLKMSVLRKNIDRGGKGSEGLSLVS